MARNGTLQSCHVRPLGAQLTVELYECLTDQFDNLDWVREVLLQAAICARATVVDALFHKFNPIGISGVVVIAESHLAIHTWPEHRYAAVDIFTCGEVLDGNAAISHIAAHFQSAHYTVKRMQRGLVALDAMFNQVAAAQGPQLEEQQKIA